jgi:hypothetical protein
MLCPQIFCFSSLFPSCSHHVPIMFSTCSHHVHRLDTEAHFTLGVRAEKNLGPTFNHFLLVFWPQVLICKNIDVRILINTGTLAPRVAKLPSQIRWYPFFQPWGQYKAINKVQHLLVTWGRLKRIFFLFQP